MAPNAEGKPQFGNYVWKSFAEVNATCEKLSRGIMELGLCPDIEGEGKQWRFLGIWMKNRWEWTTSLLSAMHFSITAVGFYDAMSLDQVDFILNQTEMKTMVVTPDYAQKIVGMKKQGKASNIDALIVSGECSADLLTAASEISLNIHSFESVCQRGESSELEF